MGRRALDTHCTEVARRNVTSLREWYLRTLCIDRFVILPQSGHEIQLQVISGSGLLDRIKSFRGTSKVEYTYQNRGRATLADNGCWSVHGEWC